MAIAKSPAPILGHLSRLFRIGLVGMGVLCLCVAAYVAISGKWATLSQVGIWTFIILPLALAVASFTGAIKLSNNGLFRLVREGCLLIIAALAVEISLTLFFPKTGNLIEVRQAAARNLGKHFDTRSITEVVEDLNAQGITAYPTFPVSWVRRPNARRRIPETIYPLSNISNVTIVECNETGKYLTYRSDEHGFHNPPNRFQDLPLQIAAVGTSFTLGRCVDSDQNMVAHIRNSYPRTLNVGMTGAGPYTKLGIFREFVEPLRPRVVLWFIFPGTLDTHEEAQNQILKHYLDPGFRQDLMHRQPEVDAILERSVPEIQREFDQRLKKKAANAESSKFPWYNVAKLWQVRSRLLQNAAFERSDKSVDLRPFVNILRLVNHTVNAWGGDLYAVYIPDYAEVVEKTGLSGITVKQVAPLVAREGIPLIDGVSVFLAQKDPASLYALHIRGHFNTDGHKLMADTILKRLRADLGGVL